MPSPVAHCLVGLAIAHAGRTQRWIPSHWAWFVAIVAAANLADVDFVTGALSTGYTYLFSHHGITHGLLAALVAGVAGALAARYAGVSRAAPAGLAVGLAYLSHVAMDFTAGEVGLDTDLPLFWPYLDIWPATPIRLFAEFHYNDRANSIPAFLASMWRRDNVIVIAQEIVVVGGFLALARTAVFLRDRTSVGTR